MNKTTRPAAPTVAYVISRYPAVSHTFIRGEIKALRALGATIYTIGLRESGSDDILTATDRADKDSTMAIRPLRARRFILAHLRAFFGHPTRYLKTAAFALRGSDGTPLRQLAYFAQALMVWQHCVAVGATHIHAHFERPSADVAMLAALFGGQRRGWTWSFTAHSPTQYLGDKNSMARKLKYASFVVCVSQFGKSQLMAQSDYSLWPNFHLVRCGIDPAVYHPEGNARTAVTSILTVARLEALKGHAILLEAFAQMRDAGVSFRAVFVGDGPERQRLEDLTSLLDLDSVVRFAGSVGHDLVRDCYAATDIFCLPSFIEGVPVVLMEAMAMHLPVVATRVNGIPELVKDGVSGRLVDPGSAPALSMALREMLALSEADRAAMGRAGRERVLDEFRSDNSARTLYELFESVGPSAPTRGRRLPGRT